MARGRRSCMEKIIKNAEAKRMEAFQASLPENFPQGINVLLVDDDQVCLKSIEQMLKDCGYNVSTCSSAMTALSHIQQNREAFDLIIFDVDIQDMDGFEFLKFVRLATDLPVIMMFTDLRSNIMLKGMYHGACDFLIKPVVAVNELRKIWQHVARKYLSDYKQKKAEGNEQEVTNKKRINSTENDHEDNANYFRPKKARMVWTPELHQKFVDAVNLLNGPENAQPLKILELMGEPDITREHVASHLQKYRDKTIIQNSTPNALLCSSSFSNAEMDNALAAQDRNQRQAMIPAQAIQDNHQLAYPVQAIQPVWQNPNLMLDSYELPSTRPVNQFSNMRQHLGGSFTNGDINTGPLHENTADANIGLPNGSSFHYNVSSNIQNDSSMPFNFSDQCWRSFDSDAEADLRTITENFRSTELPSMQSDDRFSYTRLEERFRNGDESNAFRISLALLQENAPDENIDLPNGSSSLHTDSSNIQNENLMHSNFSDQPRRNLDSADEDIRTNTGNNCKSI